jgi:hypothetical protein
VDNYFNYFTEIEEHFQRRRGTILLLSTLDWALIETWKDAGIPLEAVLRGIDAAFDRWERRPSKTRKVNGLAYCAQEVLTAAEDMKEAETGAAQREQRPTPGLQPAEISAYLQGNAAQLEAAYEKLPAATQALAGETAKSLRELASAHVCQNQADVGRPQPSRPSVRPEDLERHLTVLEDKLLASLLASTPDDQLLGVRAEAERELAPYRRNMSGPQIEQLQKQYVHKRLFERYGLPRLSLFYM